MTIIEARQVWTIKNSNMDRKENSIQITKIDDRYVYYNWAGVSDIYFLSIFLENSYYYNEKLTTEYLIKDIIE